MIGRLQGTLLEKQAPFLLLDVQGVGYEVQAPMTTFYQMGNVGENVVLHTHFAVSETAQQLFGFARRSDRKLFRTLIKVNGVGPKMAISILSGMEADAIARCVMDDNTAALVKVPGVGKKTAERLIIELRDKLKDWQLDGGELDAMAAASQARSPEPSSQDLMAEAESALISLGYKPAEASKAIARAAKLDQMDSSEALIRAALRGMLPA
jgi:Holliday junction DNA helicase RuvA